MRHDGTTENGYRAVYLLRYQENVIWAWTIPVSDENLEIISHRCQRLNELSDQFESDARSIPRDTSELTADVKMLADIVGALIEAYQSDVRNIVQEPAMREDDLNQLRRLVGNITGSVIDYE